MIEAHLQLYETVTFKPGALSPKMREMSVEESKANECPYCIYHHSNALLQVTSRRQSLSQIAEDYRKADLTFWKESDYAVNLTHSPYKMMGADIMGLRDANLMIKGFFEVNHMAVHYNYANRIVSRLGVELKTD